MTQNDHYTDGAAEMNQGTLTQDTGGSMTQLNIYQCAVEKKNRPYGANVFVLGRSFTEVEQALSSDPNVKLFEIRLFGEEGAVLTDQGGGRLMVNAANFMDMTKSAEGGYQGLSIADQIDRLHEGSAPF